MDTWQQPTLAGIALCAAALAGCGSFVDDLDLDTFTQAPAIEGFDLSRLRPAESVTYVELRRGDYSPEPTVLSSTGEKCAEAADQAACIAAFDALSTEGGFGACADCMSFHYYAVNRGDESWTAGARAELVDFFGPVDAPEEALSLASSDRYYWSPTAKEEGAYRQADSGYELIVKKLVSSCAPVETDLFLLWVQADGAIEILEDEVLEKEEGACI